MVLSTLGLLAGLALLTYSSDQFVIGATRVAAALKLSTVVIGAVVIGFGTSAPEMVISGIAAARGQVDLAVGNVIGSNVANLTLVLGVAALVTPIAVRSSVLKREAPLALAAVVLFALLVQNGLGTADGVWLIVILVAALAVILVSARQGDPALADEVAAFLTTDTPPLRRESVRTLLGLLFVVGAAQLVVVSATRIALDLGLDEGFVGVTIVAIGTSLPELATAIQAARRRETDLIVGNLLGSNLFNAGAVGAVIAFAGQGQAVGATLTGPATAIMVIVAVLSLAFMITGTRVARSEAVVLLVGYFAAFPLISR